MALAVAVIRLAGEHVVVQELHAVEGLARVDVFCVDKTGTLTTGTMQVERFDPIDTDIEVVRQGVSSLMQTDPNPTTTLRVIAEHVGQTAQWVVEHHVPFSSARKWSGATFEVPERAGPAEGIDRTWLLGAPEILLDLVDPAAAATITADIEQAIHDANRVVLIASTPDTLTDSTLPEWLTPRAVIALSEQIRPDARDTMEYFRRQNVTIKVISGDNPATVSAVASRIGLEHADRAIDMRHVDTEDRAALTELIDHNAVFGRVLPEQKRAIVGALQHAGHTVAMTGDGVNDIPALKLADIGIAMNTATPATKAISQLVLLDGRFDRMPNVVAEGRRVIANMERVSALFVTKTVYAALFALTIGLSGSIFPFLPAPDESGFRAHDRLAGVLPELPSRRRPVPSRLPASCAAVRPAGRSGRRRRDLDGVLGGTIVGGRCHLGPVAFGFDDRTGAVRLLGAVRADDTRRPARCDPVVVADRTVRTDAGDRPDPGLLQARLAAPDGPDLDRGDRGRWRGVGAGDRT